MKGSRVSVWGGGLQGWGRVEKGYSLNSRSFFAGSYSDARAIRVVAECACVIFQGER